MSLNRAVANLVELSKLRITLLVTITAMAGYLLGAARFDARAALLGLGVALLASGASALNQVQEWQYDAKMERTRNRPIPAGRMTPGGGLVLAIMLLLTGSALLAGTGKWQPVAVGLLTALWYNGVYTTLKRVTPLAIIPGSLVGALPPIIGWTAAGGGAFAPPIVALGFFLFVWQIPHFWILLMKFGSQYGEAGMPTLTTKFDNAQLGRITSSWIIGTVAVCCSLPWFGLGQTKVLYIMLCILGGWMLQAGAGLVTAPENPWVIRRAFQRINVYALLVVTLLAAERIILVHTSL